MGMKKQIRDRCQKYLMPCRRLIKNYLSALADETGELLALKLVGVTVVSVVVVAAIVPETYDRYAAQGVVISGLAMVAYGVFGPWDL
jgi:hypothetical protein